MEDKAKEISGVVWMWYKKCLAETPKTEETWDGIIVSGNKIIDRYKDDELNGKFAEEMVLTFINHIERLEKAGGGRNEQVSVS